MNDAYERLVERAREASRRLSAELEEINEPPTGDDGRGRVLKSRLNDVLRGMRKLILFDKAVASVRGKWRKKVAASVSEDYAEDVPFEPPFEPPY